MKRLDFWDSFEVSGSLAAGKWQTVAGERGGREKGEVRSKKGKGRKGAPTSRLGALRSAGGAAKVGRHN